MMPTHSHGVSEVSPKSLNPAVSSELIAGMFPAGVAAAELRESGDVSLLLPGEAECLGRAAAGRRQEFAAGRLCARRALMEFGVEDFPLRVAHDRQPVWPDSMAGSITHTAGFCAAVVAERHRFIGLGIDAEIVGHVTAALWPTICTPREIDGLRSHAGCDQAAAAALLFAAKEAFYKCQYAVVHEWLDFQDISVETEVRGTGQGVFTVTPARRLQVANQAAMPMAGEYRFHGAWVLAGLALPAKQAPGSLTSL
jgi:4'-phosphopantetheinyl transferase EntD